MIQGPTGLGERFGTYALPVNHAVRIVGIAMTAFHIFVLAFYPVEPWTMRAVHLSFVCVLGFTLFPASRQAPARYHWLDAVLIAASVGSTVYIYLTFDDLIYRVGVIPNDLDILFGVATIIVVLELTRRGTGLTLPIITLFFVTYVFVGQHLPGMLSHSGYSFSRAVSFLFGQDAIYGTPLGVSATYIFLFITFGAFLQASGGGQFFIDLAHAAAGRTVGGQAKVSVLASALFGTISGSSVANVVTTGNLTIPLMKRAGYRSTFAGAVEAVASTGGQIMPPVMGAGAFLMAELIGVPYADIVVAATVPALLFFFSVLLMVDLEARKSNLIATADPSGSKQRLWREAHLLIPLLILIYALVVERSSPIRAGLLAILATVIVSWIRTDTRMGPGKILTTMYDSACRIIVVAATCACAGIIIGVLSLTGLAVKFASIIVSLSGGVELLALLLAMVISLILGMGLPTVAAYAIAGSVVGPPLIQLGLPELPVHLFIFYFATISAITPPIALAAFAAAALAEASPLRVGFVAIKLGSASLIIPYMFMYGPALFLDGTWDAILLTLISAIIGVCALGVALQGWLRSELVLASRTALLLAAIALIKPGLVTDAAGLGLCALAFAIEWLRRTLSQRAVSRRGCNESSYVSTKTKSWLHATKE